MLWLGAGTVWHTGLVSHSDPQIYCILCAKCVWCWLTCHRWCMWTQETAQSLEASEWFEQSLEFSSQSLTAQVRSLIVMPVYTVFAIIICLQEQISQVLDAMFEKTVSTGEHIIDQDDDGDNFYVIERCGSYDFCCTSNIWVYNFLSVALNCFIASFIQGDFWHPCEVRGHHKNSGLIRQPWEFRGAGADV